MSTSCSSDPRAPSLIARPARLAPRRRPCQRAPAAAGQASRAARRARALTQAKLARRSGTSRVTVACIEGGTARDVRVGTVAALCDALGLELAAIPSGSVAALETLLARERERSRRLDQRWRHAALAARLLCASPEEAQSLVARARAVVDRWDRERLCSRHYVSRWRAMLAGPPRRVARALVEPGPWTDALLQNTPWAFALAAPAP